MNHPEIEVLLVEDNIDDAELTIRALNKNTLIKNLVHVKDGAEALDFLTGQGMYEGRPVENRPKIILLDLNMPKISGIDLLRHIKQDKRLKEIPVIVLTSSRESPDVKTCYELGANSYIVKPVGYENFMSAIKDLGFYWLVCNHQ